MLDALHVCRWIPANCMKSRLSYNYHRKGGYSIGSEDYRWEVLRQYINPPLFVLFDIVFISFLQSVRKDLSS